MALTIQVLYIAPARHGNLRASATVTVGDNFQGQFEVWATETGYIVQGAQTRFLIDSECPDEIAAGPPAFAFKGSLMARITESVLKSYKHNCPNDKPYSPDDRSLWNEERT